MPFDIKITQLNTMSAVNAVSSTLRKIDKRLVDHGERVAYIACELCRSGKLQLDLQTMFLLGVFHDVGAYKTDEIDRMLEFETNNVWNHSIYGYLFMKYMSPLKDYSEAILYHHTPWKHVVTSKAACRDYAGLIHLADRIDIAAAYGEKSVQFQKLLSNEKGLFGEELVEILRSKVDKTRLLRELKDGSYRKRNLEISVEFGIDATEALEYLKMIVYAIDFRSEHTVTHTINTTSVALNIARHFGLDDTELEKIYLGALLHDVGKVAIPQEILEFPGKLSDEQMSVMRTHVYETEQLIRSIVPDDICEIAVRHHEKLDGSGYPHGLSDGELTFPQRIVAVADIVSALSSQRSYKEPFPRDKTIFILNEMKTTKLDTEICEYVCCNYDEIMDTTGNERASIIERYGNIKNDFMRIIGKIDEATKEECSK